MRAPRNDVITLGSYGRDRVRWACRRCPLHGQYRTDALLAKVGPDIAMPDLLWKLAEASGCDRRRDDYSSPCGRHYVDVGMP